MGPGPRLARGFQHAGAHDRTDGIRERDVRGDSPAKKGRLFLKPVGINSIEKVKRIIQAVRTDIGAMPLEKADIVVCGGFGVGSKEGFSLLEDLANTLGGVVAGTRKAVDHGWIDFSQQIGQTGRVVRPRVYIGCGVSGAIHHMIGMKHSKVIIAINNDPRAPIFKIATIGIVGDFFTLVPKLKNRYQIAPG